MQIEIAFDVLLGELTNFRPAEGEHLDMAKGVVLTPERLPVVFDRRAR
jgi:hypothetical protein